MLTNRSAPHARVTPVLTGADVRAVVAWYADVFEFVEHVRISEGHRSQLGLPDGQPAELVVAEVEPGRRTPQGRRFHQTLLKVALAHAKPPRPNIASHREASQGRNSLGSQTLAVSRRRWFTLLMGESTLDRPEADLERREADLQRREAEMTAHEAALAHRTQAAHEILEVADQRDASANARDAAADQRENELDLVRILSPHTVNYGDDWPERRNAGLDRRSSKGDREASHDDRVHLTEGPDTDDPDQS